MRKGPRVTLIETSLCWHVVLAIRRRRFGFHCVVDNNQSMTGLSIPVVSNFCLLRGSTTALGAEPRQ